MRRILLINPNASARTTTMMVKIARGCVPADWQVEECTAGTGVEMILDEREIALASNEWPGRGRAPTRTTMAS